MKLEEVLRYNSIWYLRTSAFVVDMGTQSTMAQFNSLRPGSEAKK